MEPWWEGQAVQTGFVDWLTPATRGAMGSASDLTAGVCSSHCFSSGLFPANLPVLAPVVFMDQSWSEALQCLIPLLVCDVVRVSHPAPLCLVDLLHPGFFIPHIFSSVCCDQRVLLSLPGVALFVSLPPSQCLCPPSHAGPV